MDHHQALNCYKMCSEQVLCISSTKQPHALDERPYSTITPDVLFWFKAILGALPLILTQGTTIGIMICWNASRFPITFLNMELKFNNQDGDITPKFYMVGRGRGRDERERGKRGRGGERGWGGGVCVVGGGCGCGGWWVWVWEWLGGKKTDTQDRQKISKLIFLFQLSALFLVKKLGLIITTFKFIEAKQLAN